MALPVPTGRLKTKGMEFHQIVGDYRHVVCSVIRQRPQRRPRSGTDAFAAAVSKLLAERALRAELIKNGPELATQCAWEGIMTKVHELVQDTVIAFREK